MIATTDDNDRIATLSREGEAHALERNWKAPQRLRPEHKTVLKQYFSLKQGRDGKTAMCMMCNTLFEIRQLQIHHIDHIINHNELSNLQPVCQHCNDKERGEWLATSRGSLSNQLKKENESQKVEQKLQTQLLKQAPTTFQHSKRYKQQVREYLVQYVAIEKGKKQFDDVVADVEAITGCSHQKAIEYLNAESLSVFAGWHQWFDPDDNSQWIASRGKGNPAYERALAEHNKKEPST